MHALNRGFLIAVVLSIGAALLWTLWPKAAEVAPAPIDVHDRGGDTRPVVAALGEARRAVLDMPASTEALRVRGRVLDPFGEPVASALVGDATSDTPVRTATDGRFELPIENSVETLTLLVLAAGQPPLLVPLDLGGATHVHDAGDLVLRHAGSVRGSVTANGASLPGATVTLLLQAGGVVPAGLDLTRLLPPQTTDASGGYTFGRLMPGSYRIGVAATGMQNGSSRITVREGVETRVDPIDLTKGHELDGIVLDGDDRPVAGAAVRLRGGSNQPRSQTATTSGTDGSFHLEALPPGLLRVEASKPGYLPARAEVDASRAQRLVLHLADGLHIHGVVTDAHQGRPVERFALTVRRLGDLDPTTNGSMTQQLQRRAEALRASAAVESDTTVQRQQLELAAQLDTRLRALQQWRRPPVSAPPADLGPEQQHGEGRFRCDGLDEGLYVVGVASPHHHYVESEVVELRAGAPSPELRITVESGHRIAGVVVLQRDGSPVADARVELVAVDPAPLERGAADASERGPYPWAFASGPPGTTVTTTRTDAAGRFWFAHAAAGAYSLAVRRPGIANHDSDVLRVQSDRQDLRLAVGETASLSGRVQEARGRPDDLAVLVLGGHGQLQTASVQPDRTYRFADLQPGSYLVRAFPASNRQYQRRLLGSVFAPRAGAVERDKIPPCDVTLAPGEQRVLDVDVDLPATGEVSGTLSINERAASRSRVVLQPVPGEAPGAGGLPLRTDCDESGRFHLADVPAGNYTLFLYGASRQELHRQPLTVAPGESVQVQSNLRAGALRGRILTPDATATRDLRGYVWLLPGATAAPEDLYDYRRSHRTHRLSVRNGAFEDAALTPGPAVAVVDIRGRKRLSTTLVVPTGDVLDLDLTIGAR